MVVTPNSRIILLKSPLKLDHYNQITFNNANDQFDYFYNLPKLQDYTYSYIRKDGVIRVETSDSLDYEDLLRYNYCMYQNQSYDMKWFYAFITDIKYVNDGMTEIQIETDVFQTWQFDIVYKNSFIEREHVSNDTRGAHTIPEGLELGEYKTNSWNKLDLLTTNYILMASTVDPKDSGFQENGGDVYGGVFQGYCLYAWPNTSAGRLDLQNTLVDMNLNAKLDSIVALFLCNPFFFETESVGMGVKVEPSTSPMGFTWGHVSASQSDVPIAKLSTLDGYTPKNNKLLTFPYMYLLLDNGNGAQAVYRYENFTNSITANTCDFDIVGTPSIGGSYFASPLNYNSLAGDCFNDRLLGGKLPICGFQNDLFTNWMTQNGVSTTVGLVANTLSASAGIALAPFTAGASLVQTGAGIGGIAQSVMQIQEASLQSPQAEGNTATGDVNFATGLTTFTAYAKSIKYEYAVMIDNYFSMFGYKVNRLATPNIHKRSNWDYMKCIDVNLEGDIPEADMDKIRRLFNEGCTFWHTTSYYLDYSRTNSIL